LLDSSPRRAKLSWRKDSYYSDESFASGVRLRCRSSSMFFLFTAHAFKLAVEIT
jgi:hypothetical protein